MTALGAEQARPALPDPPERGALRYWLYEGVLLCGDDDATVSVEELLEFAQHAREYYPEARVRLHRFGLRVSKLRGTGDGPALEWRDWD